MSAGFTNAESGTGWDCLQSELREARKKVSRLEAIERGFLAEREARQTVDGGK